MPKTSNKGRDAAARSKVEAAPPLNPHCWSPTPPNPYKKCSKTSSRSRAENLDERIARSEASLDDGALSQLMESIEKKVPVKPIEPSKQRHRHQQQQQQSRDGFSFNLPTTVTISASQQDNSLLTFTPSKSTPQKKDMNIVTPIRIPYKKCNSANKARSSSAMSTAVLPPMHQACPNNPTKSTAETVDERIAISEESIDDAALQQLMDNVDKTKMHAKYSTLEPRRLDIDFQDTTTMESIEKNGTSSTPRNPYYQSIAVTTPGRNSYERNTGTISTTSRTSVGNPYKRNETTVVSTPTKQINVDNYNDEDLDDSVLSEMMDRIESSQSQQCKSRTSSTSPRKRINAYRDSMLKFTSAPGEQQEFSETTLPLTQMVDNDWEVGAKDNDDDETRRGRDIADILKERRLMEDYLNMKYVNLIRQKQREQQSGNSSDGDTISNEEQRTLCEKINYIALNAKYFTTKFINAIHSIREYGNMALAANKNQSDNQNKLLLLPPRHVLEQAVHLYRCEKELHETLNDADDLGV